MTGTVLGSGSDPPESVNLTQGRAGASGKERDSER